MLFSGEIIDFKPRYLSGVVSELFWAGGGGRHPLNRNVANDWRSIAETLPVCFTTSFPFVLFSEAERREHFRHNHFPCRFCYYLRWALLVLSSVNSLIPTNPNNGIETRHLTHWNVTL